MESHVLPILAKQLPPVIGSAIGLYETLGRPLFLDSRPSATALAMIEHGSPIANQLVLDN